jgi:hypothetical protein
VLSDAIVALCWGPGKNPRRVTHSPLIPTRPTSDCPLKHCSLVHSAVNTAFVLVSCSSQAYDREQVRPEGYSNGGALFGLTLWIKQQRSLPSFDTVMICGYFWQL